MCGAAAAAAGDRDQRASEIGNVDCARTGCWTKTPAHPSMAIAANKEFHKWKHQKTFHPVSLVHAELDEKHYPASPSLDVILSAVYIFCNSMFDLKYSRQYWGPHRGRGYGMAFLSKKRGTVAK